MTILNKTLTLGEENIRIKVEYDENGLNPRTDFDCNASEMICFHSRYNLGDNHNYSSIENFLVSIIESNLTDIEKEVLLKPSFEKAYPNIQIDIDYENETFDINYDYKRYDRTIVQCGYASYNFDIESLSDDIEHAKNEMFLDFINSDLEDLEVYDLVGIVEQIENIVFLPLYLYDHSGITMNTTGFSCGWDSGQVGWIYNSIEAYHKETGNNFTKEQIKEDFISQVKLYDKYIGGEVYWYQVEKEIECDCCSSVKYEEVDSCGGFFDSEDIIESIVYGSKTIKKEYKEEVETFLENELKYL